MIRVPCVHGKQIIVEFELQPDLNLNLSKLYCLQRMVKLGTRDVFNHKPHQLAKSILQETKFRPKWLNRFLILTTS